MTPDVAPAAREMSRLLASIDDDQLNGRTPCEDYRLGDLVDHIVTLVDGFTAAAAKKPDPAPRAPPPTRRGYPPTGGTGSTRRSTCSSTRGLIRRPGRDEHTSVAWPSTAAKPVSSSLANWSFTGGTWPGRLGKPTGRILPRWLW